MISAAILSEIGAIDVPRETVDSSIPIVKDNVPVVSAIPPKKLGDFFSDRTIKLLVIVNTIFMIGYILELW